MPPPMSNQGSRAGLITSLIVSIVLLMVCLVMFIYSNAERTKLEKDNKQLTEKYRNVAHNDQLPEGGDVSTIDAAKEKLGLTSSSSTSDTALAQIRQLSKDITGAEANNFIDADAQAVTLYTKAMAALNPKGAPTTAPAGTTGLPPGESLASVVTKLTTGLQQASQTVATQTAALNAVKADLETRSKAWEAQLAELGTKLADAEKRAADAQAAVAEAQKNYATKETASAESSKANAENVGKQAADLQEKLAKALADMSGLQKKYDQVNAQLAKYRGDVRDATVRQADGTIIRVPSKDVCYVSLGQGDHIAAGTTFEVYDKGEGVPPLGKDPLTDANLPVGKASIEIVRVGQNSSECRIVHQQPGTTLSEGDIIANLVYDRNTTFNFFVFGSFDVDGNNIWTPQEGDIVRSLVTRWGGKLVQGALPTVNTDFVVLGQEPQVPAFTKQDLEDPLNRDKYDKAVKALSEYQAVVNQAVSLHIPIMNQNRFMYYIGYFDQMKR
jgi:hypothetical protein